MIVGRNSNENIHKNQDTKNKEERFAITFGEVAILHVGGMEIGGGRRETGFAVSELITIKKNLEDKNYHCELFMLSDTTSCSEAKRQCTQRTILSRQ